MIVELNNLLFFAHHGLYEAEKTGGGQFMVDVLLESDSKASYMSLEDVLNYEEIFAIVQAEMNKPRDFIEEVARSIKEGLVRAFPEAERIEIRVTKITPPIPGMKGSARVTEIFRK